MIQQNSAVSSPGVLYDDVERAILEQEAADPAWHFGFNPNLPAHPAELSPEAMAAQLSAGNLAQAQSFAGRMLRRWLRTNDDRRAQYWRDVASALARTGS
jgi:hypothetical protein